jgi:cyclase
METQFRFLRAWALIAVIVVALVSVHAAAQRLSPGRPAPAQISAGGNSRVEVLPVHGQVFLVASDTANATVQVGPQGVLVVDTMTEELSGDLVKAIQQLAPGKPIRYVLNTHAHSDHTGGNAKVAAAGSQLVAGNFLRDLGQAGSQSAFIVAHENILNALVRPLANRPATPFAALPTDTFFQQQKDMYFNGEAVQLIHVPHAHTDGDTVVYFRGSDVVCAGDLYSTTQYPRVDASRNGDVNGVIDGLNVLIDIIVSEQFTEGGTQVVPGHGRISDELDVVEYRDMVTIVRDRVREMMGRGLSLDQVKAARPTLDWDPRYGGDTGGWTAAMFVEAVYNSLRAADVVSPSTVISR